MHLHAPTISQQRPSSSRLFIVLLLSLAAFGTLLRPTLAQHDPDNGTNIIEIEEDRSKAENAIQLVKHFKEHIRKQIWAIYNRTQLASDESIGIQANESLSKGDGCSAKLKLALESSDNTTAFEWLLQMYDSSGTAPSGLLSGTTISLGDFDQCLRVAENGQFDETQYCLLTLKARRRGTFNYFQFDEQQESQLTAWEREHLEKWLITDNKVPIVVGLCLPALCNDKEKDIIAKGASNLVEHFNAKVQYCQDNSQDSIDKFILVLPLLLAYSLLSGLCGLGSSLDYLASTQFGRSRSALLNSFFIRLLRCFSMNTNLMILFNVKSRNASTSKAASSTVSNGTKTAIDQTNTTTVPLTSGERHRKLINLEVLDGIRVHAILWIIVAHCSSFTQVPYLMKVSPLAHFPDDFFRNKADNWLVSAYLLSTYYPVSIFFMISGILVIYNYKKNKQCDVKEHFFKHLVLRVLRLSPTLLATVGVTYFLRYLGSGPLFHQDLVAPYVEPCRTHFWYHFFFVHNYLPIDERCGSHTWYVGADFQLNMVAFFVVHLIRCRSKWFFGLFLTFAIIATSGLIPLALVTFGIGQIPNFDSFVDPRISLPVSDLQLFYYATYIHAGSFFIGVTLGYVFSSGWNLSFIKRNKILRFVLFHGSGGTMMVVPLAMRYFVFPADATETTTRSPLLTAFLFQFFSYAFNFAMATFILVLALNPSLYLTKYLSAKCLRPVARMVFSAYLSHQVFIWFSLHQYRYPLVLNIYTFISFTSMIVCMTSMASMTLYLMVECPFIRIGKLLFEGTSKGANSQLTHPSSTGDGSLHECGEHLESDKEEGNELQSIIVRQTHSSDEPARVMATFGGVEESAGEDLNNNSAAAVNTRNGLNA